MSEHLILYKQNLNEGYMPRVLIIVDDTNKHLFIIIMYYHRTRQMEQGRIFHNRVKIKSIQWDNYPVVILLARPIITRGISTKILKLPMYLGEDDTAFIKCLIPGTKLVMYFNENYIISRIDDHFLEYESSSSTSNGE